MLHKVLIVQPIILSVLHNYFDLTKLFSDYLYLPKFLVILAKSFFPCTMMY